MFDKLKQKMANVRDMTENATAELIPESRKAPTHVSDARWAECSNCELLYKPTHTCKACGCFMLVKTKMAYAKCPKGKWPALTEEEMNQYLQSK